MDGEFKKAQVVVPGEKLTKFTRHENMPNDVEKQIDAVNLEVEQQ